MGGTCPGGGEVMYCHLLFCIILSLSLRTDVCPVDFKKHSCHILPYRLAGPDKIYLAIHCSIDERMCMAYIRTLVLCPTLG